MMIITILSYNHFYFVIVVIMISKANISIDIYVKSFGISFIILSIYGLIMYVVINPYIPHTPIYSRHMYFPILYFLSV